MHVTLNPTPQDISGLKDILYGNLQRDRGLRAILEAVVGTVLLLKLQPKLGLLFSLVIPSVATVTAQLGRRLTRTVLQEVGVRAIDCVQQIMHHHEPDAAGVARSVLARPPASVPSIGR